MLPTTLEIVRAALKADPTIKPDEGTKLIALLRNPDAKPASAPPEDKPRVVKKRVAMERLGFKSKSTRSVDRLCAQGVLKKVKLPGRKYAGGILESSLNDLIASMESGA